MGTLKEIPPNSPHPLPLLLLLLRSVHLIFNRGNSRIMKKLLLSLFAAASLLQVRADEGMWIPMLIGKNYAEMEKLGLRLTADDIYNINHSSLKDAIVQFNGGCTAEMISGSGLLLTNHHCGYDAIAGLSSVKDNYLDNGFWAYSHKEELPAKGLYVTFLEYMEDVTEEINNATGKSKGEKFDKKLKAAVEKIEKRAGQDGKYVAQVREFFNGNQYILLVYKKYTDVRLVGTPPRSIGKFGGDTDNWIWPRHTGDFSMFRIYANKNNEPANYSADNVPYQPKKFLPISIKGVQENDFAMILGYPGRTNRYEVSYGVDLALREVNQSIVNIRDKRLSIMKKHMDQDKEVYLKLTSNYSRISNYWKYYIGQTEQLNRLKVVDRKIREEQKFVQWAQKNAPEYKNLMNQYAAIYAAYKPYAKHVTYYYECFRGASLARMAAVVEPLYTELQKKKPDADSIKHHVKMLKQARRALLTEFDLNVEKEVFAAMSKMYYEDVPRSQHPDIYQKEIFSKFGEGNLEQTFNNYANYVFENTFLINEDRFNEFCENPSIERIENDPAARYSISFVRNFRDYYQPKSEAFAKEKKELSKQYVKGLMEMKGDGLMYPDANSTMRLTYGQVKGYEPQDAVQFNYLTTIDGMMDKYKPGDDEFDLPKELIELYKKKDFGKYMSSDSTLYVNFITTNDITGGNSGSPIINGKGELIGCAFDGNWEAMSGDIAFDKQYKRTIAVDARFILFIVEKLGKAHNLIEEMQINN